MFRRSYSRPFSKKSKLSVFLLNCLKFIFITYQGDGYRNILKLSCRPLGFDSYKNFKIISKRRSGNILLASISTEKYFGEEYFSCFILLAGWVSLPAIWLGDWGGPWFLFGVVRCGGVGGLGTGL